VSEHRLVLPVLVVDDDPLMQRTIASILDDAGYQVQCAANGREALAVLDQGFQPALVVLDITMPQLDGYGFVEELTRRDLRPGLPILVVTADGRAREKAARVGAEGHLAKPFALDALVDEVGRLVLPDAASASR
jgi:two-component system, chemotaxis family, chemotaxis protein CheY